MPNPLVLVLVFVCDRHSQIDLLPVVRCDGLTCRLGYLCDRPLCKSWLHLGQTRASAIGLIKGNDVLLLDARQIVTRNRAIAFLFKSWLNPSASERSALVNGAIALCIKGLLRLIAPEQPQTL